MAYPRLFRVVKWLAAITLILIGGLYLALTSSTVMRAVVPKIADYYGYKVSAQEIDLAPFSGLNVKGLSVSEGDEPPLVKECDIEFAYTFSRLFSNELLADVLSLRQCAVHLPAPSDSPSEDTPLEGGEGESTFKWLVKKLTIENAQLAYPHEGVTITGLSANGNDLGSHSPSTLTLNAGKVSVEKEGELSVNGPLHIEASLPDLNFSSEKFKLLLKSEALQLTTSQATLDNSSVVIDLDGESFKKIDFTGTASSLRLGDPDRASNAALRLNGAYEQVSDGGHKIDFKEVTLGKDDSQSIKLSGSTTINPARNTVALALTSLKIADSVARPFLNAEMALPTVQLGGEHDLDFNWSPLSIKGTGKLSIIELSAPGMFSENADLSGTELDYKLSFLDNTFTCEGCKLSIVSSGAQTGAVTIDTKLNFPTKNKKSLSGNVSINGQELDITKLQQLAPTPKEPAAPEPKVETASPESTTDLPELSVNAVLESTKFAGTVIPSIKAALTTGGALLTLESFQVKLLGGETNAAGSYSLAGSQPFTIRASSDHFDLKPFLANSFPEQAEFMHGSITNIFIDMRGDAAKLDPTLEGRFKLESGDVTLPSKLQDYPPLNLLFLPFRALADALGAVSGVMLPESIGGIGSEIRNVLSESGRLLIKRLDIDLEAKDGDVIVHAIDMNPDLLPRARMDGTIGLDGGLDLNTYFTIAATRIPMPIAGTVSLPLPNVVMFVPELVKALGFSVLDIAGGIQGMFVEDSSLPTPSVRSAERVGDE